VEEIIAERAPGRFPSVREWAVDTPASTYRALWDVVSAYFPTPSFILLERLDLVRQAASALAAMSSGQWRALPGAEMPATAAPRYDFERMAAQLQLAGYARHHWRALFAAIGAEPYYVTYETLDRDFPATMAGLLAALGSHAPAPAPRTRRQASAGTEALVLRFLRDSQARGLHR
jgi:LPS sulfotransferase NodH